MVSNDGRQDQSYRDLIDRLVAECLTGQGQIARRRAMTGTWNRNAPSDALPEQHAVNGLLQKLTIADREILARMLEEEFRGGVHTALVALHDSQIVPLDKAYEGTPYHDFVGRLDRWQWPAHATRS